MCGTVKWVAKSPFRPKCERKNWFIGIKLLPEPKYSEYETGTPGVIFQTFKSGGRDGKCANKTESAVRAIHAATGLSATASDGRSQHQNKKTALERLKALLEQSEDDDGFQPRHELNHSIKTLERGNPVRVYEGSAFKRCAVQ